VSDLRILPESNPAAVTAPSIFAISSASWRMGGDRATSIHHALVKQFKDEVGEEY